jgi:hypothetical protein
MTTNSTTSMRSSSSVPTMTPNAMPATVPEDRPDAPRLLAATSTASTGERVLVDDGDDGGCDDDAAVVDAEGDAGAVLALALSDALGSTTATVLPDALGLAAAGDDAGESDGAAVTDTAGVVDTVGVAVVDGVADGDTSCSSSSVRSKNMSDDDVEP